MKLARLEGHAIKIAIVGAVLMVIYVATRGLKKTAEVITHGAVNVAAGAATGVVEGVGGVVGIPSTDAAKCKAALDSGNRWDASKYCDAGTFLGSLWPLGSKPPLN